MNRNELTFASKGLSCSARLYLPQNSSKPPVVVMAPGFAGEQDFRLAAFAEKFVEKGLAVITFDYRNFGKSEGAPRNLVDPKRHVEDWLAAIAFARELKQVDGARIGLWGTSFSGGHVLVAAARYGKVKAVVSQVPFVDGLATVMNFSPIYNLTGIYHGLIDLIGSLFGKTHYVPVVADPDQFGLMNTPESKPGYLALVPEGSDWRNEAPARIALTLPAYRPVSYAAQISCPVLIICAENDSLNPAKAVEKCASKCKSATIISLPVGHFEVYFGDSFEKVSEMEAKFLARELLAESA